MFKGTGTALITPFDNDLNVDYEALRKIVNFQVEGGVDSLIVLGTSGETPCLSFEEKEKILSVISETVNKKIPIIVGTGSNNTNGVVKLNSLAEKYKADGALIVTPYYNKGTQESTIKHYEYISERTTLPIMLYNVPYRTGLNLVPQTVYRIAEKCKNVVAIKEASANISQIAQLFSIMPSEFEIYSGNDDQALPIMAMGGMGVISVFSNAYPKEMKILTDLIIGNNFSDARKLCNRYIPMMNLMFAETSPAPVKFIMSLMGLCKNTFRLPLDSVTDKTKEILKKAFENFPEGN